MCVMTDYSRSPSSRSLQLDFYANMEGQPPRRSGRPRKGEEPAHQIAAPLKCTLQLVFVRFLLTLGAWARTFCAVTVCFLTCRAPLLQRLP